VTVRPTGRNLVGAGLAAVGVAGGIAAGGVLLRRSRSGSDVADPADGEGLLPDDTEIHAVTMSDGAELRVLARGAGRPVVLLHGITLSADIWYRQLAGLPAAGFRVVAPDLRGHGTSTIGTGGLVLDRVADDVAELLDHLDLDDAIVVGHSMGGMIALRLLSRASSTVTLAAPDAGGPGAGGPASVTVRTPGGASRRVAALALVATSASPVVGRGVPGVRTVVGLAGPALAATARLTRLLPGPSLPDTGVGDPIARVTFGADAEARSVRLIRSVTAKVPARTSAALLLQLVSFDVEGVLGRLALPVTVAVGTGDLMTPVRHAETLVAALPDADLTVLRDCGHMVMLERPDELDDAVRALAKRAGAP
jgi:pimeloyl-ACP methyl ester carboxylesterase